jgi:hypothetical protein
MAILHKMEDKAAANSMPAKGMFVEETWQFRPEVAHALLRLMRACVCTGTWLGVSAGKKSGGLKISVRNKGIGADEWYDSASDLEELAKEVEALVDPPSLLARFLSFPEGDTPKGYKRARPGSVEEYET